MTDDEQLKKREGTIAGLRRLADLLEAEPEAKYPTYGIMIYHRVDTVQEMRELAKKFRGRWDKNGSASSFTLSQCLGGVVQYKMEIDREKVCKKRVLGTRMVWKSVPLPTYYSSFETQLVQEDIVEWDCPEILK